jgi:hypothetical protein
MQYIYCTGTCIKDSWSQKFLESSTEVLKLNKIQFTAEPTKFWVHGVILKLHVHSVDQEFLDFMEHKVHHHTHKVPPLHPILSEPNTLHCLYLISRSLILIFSSSLLLCHSNYHFSSCYQPKFCISFSVGRDIVVNMWFATGLGIESWWGQDFPYPSIPALNPPSLLYNVYQLIPGVPPPSQG